MKRTSYITNQIRHFDVAVEQLLEDSDTLCQSLKRIKNPKATQICQFLTELWGYYDILSEYSNGPEAFFQEVCRSTKVFNGNCRLIK